MVCTARMRKGFVGGKSITAWAGFKCLTVLSQCLKRLWSNNVPAREAFLSILCCPAEEKPFVKNKKKQDRFLMNFFIFYQQCINHTAEHKKESFLK